MKKSNPTYRLCPLCGNTYVTLVAKATSLPPVSPRQIQVTEKYFGLHGDLVRCQKCQFTYVGDKKYIKNLSSLYAKMSDQVYLQEEKERRLSFLRVITTIEALRKGKKGKLLDIGCCTGGLLIEAKKRGWVVDGLDPSSWACKTARHLHGLSVHNTTIEAYHSKNNVFDAITLLDVLEHVEDPDMLIRRVRSMLKENGIFCIVTPNYGSFTAKLFGKRWWGIRLAHLSYFNRNDINSLIKKNGLKILHQSTYVRYFTLYYILIRLFAFIERMNTVKSVLKHIIIPLALFDTFEIYIGKRGKLL